MYYESYVEDCNVWKTIYNILFYYQEICFIY